MSVIYADNFFNLPPIYSGRKLEVKLLKNHWPWPRYDFNEYNYDMVYVHVINTNLCKEVTGGLFSFLLYTYYMYEMYKSVLKRSGGPRKVYLLGASACRRRHLFNIYPSMAEYTTIL